MNPDIVKVTKGEEARGGGGRVEVEVNLEKGGGREKRDGSILSVILNYVCLLIGYSLYH